MCALNLIINIYKFIIDLNTIWAEIFFSKCKIILYLAILICSHRLSSCQNSQVKISPELDLIDLKETYSRNAIWRVKALILYGSDI